MSKLAQKETDLIMSLYFNFIINCKPDELNYYRALDVEKDAAVFCRYDLEWCLQTFLRLRQSTNLSVQLSNKLERDCINIIHSAQLHSSQGDSNHFIVCIKADFPRRDWAHFHIVQNRAQLTKGSAYTLFWVQPGLVMRNPTRKGVSTVAYAGQTFNGNLAGTEDSWTEALRKEGIEFKLLPSGACYDVSEVDVLIGIRSFDDNPHFSKPPSKLINAWHSKITFVGGYDSAFTQVGVPGEDYLRVKSMEETKKAIITLKDNPALYEKLVTNGLDKSKMFSNDTIVIKWEEILTGPVTKRFEDWKNRPVYEGIRFNTRKVIYNFKFAAKQLLKRTLGGSATKSLQRRLAGN